MALTHPELEGFGIERLRLATFQTLGNGGLKRIDSGLAFLILSDQVADIIARIAVLSARRLAFDPRAHLIGEGNIHRGHGVILSRDKDRRVADNVNYYGKV